MKKNEIDLKKEFGKTWTEMQKDRFKLFRNTNYKIDRWVFTFFMFLIFGWLFFVAYAHNFNLDYYECIDPNPYYDSGILCENPFYKQTSWKNQEFLPPGEYGTKPTTLFNSIFYVPFIFLFLAGVFNHLIHNRGSKK